MSSRIGWCGQTLANAECQRHKPTAATSATKLAHPTMPGVGKTPQAVVAAGRLEDSLHASMMTILPCLCKVSGEATFSLDANRHVMNQRRRLAITNSLPVTENWTRVAQMAHFVANRCHTPINPATIGRISPGMATATLLSQLSHQFQLSLYSDFRRKNGTSY